MDKSELHSEIHNGIMYLLSKDITKEELQSTIERMIDEYHESEVKKLNIPVVSGSLPLAKTDEIKHQARCMTCV